MALTQAVIDNVANAAIDYHMDKGTTYAQHIQEKPLLDELRQRQRPFPGGKGDITVRTVFDTQSSIEGFSGDDLLTFTNPTPIKTASYPWKLIHLGITMTQDELLRDGLSVVDTNGRNTRQHTQRELTMLAEILQTKLDDMTEGYAAGMNQMLWQDGSQDAKEVPGMQYLIADNPTTGVVGGIDRAVQTLWQNRAFTAAKETATTNAADGPIVFDPDTSSGIKRLRQERRQLRRYGTPRHILLCGSKALERLEAEVDAKGTYTQTGFSGEQDVGMGEIRLSGLGRFRYDPTLDDLSREDFMYFIDTNGIQLKPIEGQDMKRHYPARPHDRMVLYRSLTWAGGLCARQLNTSMVIETADPV